MADGTSIEWARHPVTGKGASWNPLLARLRDTGKLGYHCEHVSEACRYCYAEAFNRRNLPVRGTGLPFKPGHLDKLHIVIEETQLLLPLRWRDPRGVFVCSMTDLFGGWVPVELIDRVFAVMALTPWHVYFVLTKRPERAFAYLSDPETRRRIWRVADRIAADLRLGEHHPSDAYLRAGEDAAPTVLPNVWPGTSVEDQPSADLRLPFLMSMPAARRFVSAEPLLGPVNLTRIEVVPGFRISALTGGTFDRREDLAPEARDRFDAWQEESLRGYAVGLRGGLVNWVIAGFESGTQARVVADALDIARALRDQCEMASVPFFFKQWGSWAFAPEGMNFEEAMRWGRQQRYSLSRRTQAWGGSGGLPSRYEAFSNGRTAFYAGKKDTGRLLDGRTHDDMPGLAP